ncbi:MAG: glycoside hydrolase family 57 protein [Bryobacteraceae bacterium]
MMPHTYLVFVWHMHQPFYKDLATGEYQLPWTRMHALKDYYGMAAILDEFPKIRQTFNLVPSMLVQIEEYAEGRAADPFLRLALKPAEELTPPETEFILKYFFQANPGRVIGRYPRYQELFEMWRAQHVDPAGLARRMGPGGLRDLQVLSQLAWFDEIFLETDAEVRALAARGRDYTLADQQLIGRKQQQICSLVIPTYRRLAAAGRIELSVTPFYHPILPLLCDSNIASVSQPGAPLPRRFRYPEDARVQMQSALDYARQKLGVEPAGMWPSEGGVSDEVLALGAELGVRWMATDNGVLGATLNRLAGISETCRPYVWRQGGREMKLIFRDHFLSDLIGFVYSRMDPAAAAHHFLERIRENARIVHREGRDALIPVILDGENAWEYYERSGRPFLKTLYQLISQDPQISAVTVTEALERLPAVEIPRIHPGSWINANFEVWIGYEEDNLAWEYLLEARETYDRVTRSPEGALLSEADRRLAYQELLIAEGSDWCWWYGPHHHSENRAEFDQLFRSHLAQVYRALGKTPPASLSRPIARVAVEAFQQAPCGFIEPAVDGEISSYFEWLGAGVYRPDTRQGAMHGRSALLEELRYGSDGSRLFVRADMKQSIPGGLAGLELRLTARASNAETEFRFALTREGAHLSSMTGRGSRHALPHVSCAYLRIFECAVDLESIGAQPSAPLQIQVSLWREGLPLEAAPPHGWIEFVPGEPAEWE